MKKLPELNNDYYRKCPICGGVGPNELFKEHLFLEHPLWTDEEIEKLLIQKEFDFLNL